MTCRNPSNICLTQTRSEIEKMQDASSNPSPIIPNREEDGSKPKLRTPIWSQMSTKITKTKHLWKLNASFSKESILGLQSNLLKKMRNSTQRRSWMKSAIISPKQSDSICTSLKKYVLCEDNMQQKDLNWLQNQSHTSTLEAQRTHCYSDRSYETQLKKKFNWRRVETPKLAEQSHPKAEITDSEPIRTIFQQTKGPMLQDKIIQAANTHRTASPKTSRKYNLRRKRFYKTKRMVKNNIKSIHIINSPRGLFSGISKNSKDKYSRFKSKRTSARTASYIKRLLEQKHCGGIGQCLPKIPIFFDTLKRKNSSNFGLALFKHASEIQAFSDGGFTYSKAIAEELTLFDKSGLEGCLLNNSNTSGLTEIFRFFLEQQDISFQGIAIWLIISATDFHQDDERVHSYPSLRRHFASIIFRRLTYFIRFIAAILSAYSTMCRIVGNIGFYNQQKEINSFSNKRNRLFRDESEFVERNNTHPEGENQEIETGNTKNDSNTNNISEEISITCRYAYKHNSWFQNSFNPDEAISAEYCLLYEG